MRERLKERKPKERQFPKNNNKKNTCITVYRCSFFIKKYPALSMYPPHRRDRSALLLVLIVVLLVLLIVLFVLALIILLVVLLVLVAILVVHNEYSFFCCIGITYSFCPIYSLLCVPSALDCHSKWSSNAYKKDANATVDATTAGTEIHQSHG